MKNNTTKVDWEDVSFKIIGKSAEAKNHALEALQMAKKSDYSSAAEKIKLANKAIGEAGSYHMDVVVQEANGIQHDFKVLFMHSEDQFLTIQTLILVISEFIEIYKRIN